jgi:hypothetical protein
MKMYGTIQYQYQNQYGTNLVKNTDPWKPVHISVWSIIEANLVPTKT